MNLISMHGTASLNKDKDVLASRETKYIMKFGIVILLFIIGIVGVYFGNFNDKFGDAAEFGAFGDFIGGTLNPILSFFTIVLLIWSIRVQRDELFEARVQFKRTAEAQESIEKIQKEELDFYKKREAVENIKGELLNLQSQQREMLDRSFGAGEDDTLYYALVIGRNKSIINLRGTVANSLNKDEKIPFRLTNDERKFPFKYLLSDLTSFAVEYNYNLAKLNELEEYELYVMRAYSFISLVEKISKYRLGTRMHFNGLANSINTIVTQMPDLKDAHLNALKISILESVIQINLKADTLD